MSLDDPVRGGVLREGYDYSFSRCDPGTGAHVDPAWCALYETLTIAGPDGGLGPMLSERWAPLDGQSAWRFSIRPDRRFHSGPPCDAEAVAQALRLHSDPKESPINAFFWKNVRTIEAEGTSVVLHLREPAAAPPRLLRSWHSAVHNQKMRDQLGDEYGYRAADGTGPFKFVRFDPTTMFEVERWEEYPGAATNWQRNRGPAYLDGIRWIPVLSEHDRSVALEDGAVDCIQNASIFDVERLGANPDLEVTEFQQSALVYLGLDHQSTEEKFGDIRVRRAISSAIDRNALVAEDLAGHAWAAFGPIPSHSPWYDVEVEKIHRYDPQEALEQLDAAGLAPGPDGVRLRFETLVVEDATVRRISTRIQNMLRLVGVEMRLREVSGFDALYAQLSQHPKAFISKWFWPEPVDAIIGFISSWSHSGPNFQRASSPTIDAACRAWETAIDEDEQRQAAQAIQRLSARELPLIPLFFPAAVWANHKRVHGWHPPVNDLYPLYNDVWLDSA
jgi:peptide/nickel transport system substrate-binding protein